MKLNTTQVKTLQKIKMLTRCDWANINITADTEDYTGRYYEVSILDAEQQDEPMDDDRAVTWMLAELTETDCNDFTTQDVYNLTCLICAAFSSTNL